MKTIAIIKVEYMGVDILIPYKEDAVNDFKDTNCVQSTAR